MKFKLLRAIGAAALAGFAISAAYALQVDQNRLMQARQYQDYHPIYQRLTINYNDSNISTAQLFGALKKNDFIKAIDCHVTTAFNAGTTNVVTIGTSTTATEIINSGGNATTSIAPGTAGIEHLTTANLGLGPTSDADHNLYAKYTQTGTAATAGSVTCVMEIVPNNDN